MKLIAHRGGTGLRVESALAATENPIDRGAAGAALDAHPTRDGHVVVHNDPRRFAGDHPEAIAAAGGNAWFMYYRDCTEATQRETTRFGLESAAWSVNLRDPAELARLARVGVDNLAVDYPDMDSGAPGVATP